MKTLDLVLKHKWYDLIKDGIKTEEYRELKPYWVKRLMGCLKWCSIGCLYDENKIEHCRRRKCENLADLTLISGGYNVVRFHRAYTNVTMSYLIESITIGYGKSDWGAPDEEVFIIKLGKITPSPFIRKTLTIDEVPAFTY